LFGFEEEPLESWEGSREAVGWSASLAAGAQGVLADTHLGAEHCPCLRGVRARIAIYGISSPSNSSAQK